MRKCSENAIALAEKFISTPTFSGSTPLLSEKPGKKEGFTAKRRGFSCNREPLRQKMCLHFFLFIALYQWAVSPSFARSPAQGTALPRQSVPAFPQNPADQTQEFVETPSPYAGAVPPETCVPARCLALPSE